MNSGGEHFREFSSASALREHLCGHIATSITQAIQARGQALIAVSGGNTPIPLFKQLSELPLDWQNVSITLADERLVATDHPRSNERLVRETLLQGAAQNAHFLPLQSLGAAHLDLVLLGLGGDGHTASLFPDAEQLAEALTTQQPTCELQPASQPETRLSLSLHALLASTELVLHIEGDDKHQVLQQAMKPGPVEVLPIRAILHQDRVPLTIYWAA